MKTKYSALGGLILTLIFYAVWRTVMYFSGFEAAVIVALATMHGTNVFFESSKGK